MLSTKKCWNLPKRYAISQTKETTMRWYEGHNPEKSDPIHAGWATLQVKSTHHIEKPHPNEKFSAQIRGPSLDVQEEVVPGFEGQQGLITGIPYNWRVQKLHSWRVYTRSPVHEKPG